MNGNASVLRGQQRLFIALGIRLIHANGFALNELFVKNIRSGIFEYYGQTTIDLRYLQNLIALKVNNGAALSTAANGG